MVRRSWRLAAVLAFCVAAGARAGTLDRVRAEGVLRCGGTIWPGLAFPAEDGSWHGLEVELCRALAAAVLGDGARIDFHPYVLPQDYGAIRNGDDAVAFLTAAEVLEAHLLPDIVPGPAVFYAADAVVVPAGAPAQHLADLAGVLICGEPGTGPQRTLAAWFQERHLRLEFSPFQEADEMLDAFYAGRCGAIVNRATSLAALALQAAADGHPARLLPEVVAATPVMADTGGGDARWGAVVTWAMAALLAEDGAKVAGDGPRLPLDGRALGLAPGWQRRMLAATGSYEAIYRRTLGDGSPLGLPRGLNAPWTEGGLLCPPVSE